MNIDCLHGQDIDQSPKFLKVKLSKSQVFCKYEDL